MKKYTETIVTLYENHYHYGVGALLNSLVSSGFKGLFLVGYKGSIPPWINQLSQTSEKEFNINSEITVKFILIDTEIHFGYYKPQFIKHVFDTYPLVDNVYYFDPDIVVNAQWSFFKSWVKVGTALCLDNCFPFVHRNHPWRAEWKELAKNEQNTDCIIDYYVNSGFIGINRANSLLIDKWILLTEQYRISGGDVSLFEKNAHRAFKGDQDLLNAALTICPEIIISIIGTEGMGFTEPTYLMAHAIDSIKPWKANFVKEVLINGSKPSGAAKYFFSYCEYPIRIFSKRTILLKKINIKIASGIGLIMKK